MRLEQPGKRRNPYPTPTHFVQAPIASAVLLSAFPPFYSFYLSVLSFPTLFSDQSIEDKTVFVCNRLPIGSNTVWVDSVGFLDMRHG